MGVGTPQERKKRYERASTVMNYWQNMLQDAYDLTLPGRINFDNVTVGQRRSRKIFDGTSAHSIRMFANNIKSIVMPTDRNWAVFVPGSDIETDPNLSEQQKQSARKTLQEQNNIFFTHLRRSNFDSIIDSALQDMAISTGILLVNEGDADNPFYFTAVSIDKVAFEKNEKTGKIQNVWRKWQVPVDQLYILWPKAKRNKTVDHMIKTDAVQKIEIIEGSIFNYDDNKFYYYVQLSEKCEDFYMEKRDYNPWIVFRWNVRTDETVGFGPALEAIPFIAMLERISDLEAQGAALRVYPPYIGIDSAGWDVNLARIVPNSIIKVGPEFIDKDPLRPIPNNGDPEFTQIKIEKLREIIKEMLFANPLPQLSIPVRTATEIEINQQNWVRSSGTAIGRITVELLFPLIETCTKILEKMGIIDKMTLDGKIVDIRYDSELIFLQGQEENARIIDYVNIFQQILGPQLSLAVLNLSNLPFVVADNLGVDSKIVADPQQLQMVLDKARDMAKNTQSQQPQQGSPIQNPEQLSESQAQPQGEVQ